MTTDHETIAAVFKAHSHEASHVDTLAGPQVHRHLFSVAVGTRVAKVVGLSSEVEMALAVDGVSISRQGAHIAVDVPRTDRLFVDWAPLSTKGLEFFAGLDLAGKVQTVDLAKAPHLLIAGSTGSGKSVGLNAILTDWLSRLGPDEIRLHIVDPKRVELRQWEPFPQTEQFVAGSGFMAQDLISTVETIMDQRFSLFERAGVRDIGEYRAARPDEALPWQVLVIDEFADLMLGDKTLRREVENSIVRIAQLGRAAGVHMLLATQRPVREVFTGLIKANVPARWVFRVNTGLDSRVALDEGGAEDLVGMGDSLLQLPGSPTLTRLQSAAASNENITSALAASREKWPARDVEPPHSLAGSTDDEEPTDDGAGPEEAPEAATTHPAGEDPVLDLMSDEQFDAWLEKMGTAFDNDLKQNGVVL